MQMPANAIGNFPSNQKPLIDGFKSFSLNLNGKKSIFYEKRIKTPTPSKESLVEKEITCPSCGRMANFEDQCRGECTCEYCGTVVSERSIVSAVPRAFTSEDVEKKVHNNEPLNSSNRLIIVVKKSDGPEERRRANCNNRMPWSEKRIQMMKAEVMKLRTFLPITKLIEDIAMKEIRKVFKDENTQSRNIVAMGTAILHYACIQCNSSISFDDIVRYSGEERKSIRKSISILNRKLGYKFSPKMEYGDYFTKSSSILSLPQYVCTNAISIFNLIKNSERMIGDPRGLIGASIYYCCKNDDRVSKKTQKDVASSLGITEITIRKRMKDVDAFIEKSGPIQFSH